LRKLSVNHIYYVVGQGGDNGMKEKAIAIMLTALVLFTIDMSALMLHFKQVLQNMDVHVDEVSIGENMPSPKDMVNDFFDDLDDTFLLN